MPSRVGRITPCIKFLSGYPDFLSHATPKIRFFAERLLTHAAQENSSATHEFPTAIPVISKLRPHLATLMGTGGFDALIVRALALAGTEADWLLKIRVKADGSLEGLGDLQGCLDPAEITRGSVVLVASLLGLLVTFIGEILTLRLVRDIWPELPNSDNFTQGDTR